MGRINFGRAIKDFKGITSDVQLQTEQDGHEMTYTLKHWVIRTMADDYEAIKAAMASNRVEAKDNEAIVSDGGYFKGEFTLKKVGDTFLNFEAFGKGQVWVNGHAMGRIWHIGPQQTLYVPGCWLKKGKNEVIVLDIVGPKAEPIVFGQTEPELNKLNLEKSATHNQPGDKPDLNSATPVAEGQLMAGNGWQTVKFNAPQKGRYVALVARSTQKGDDEVSVAEVYVQDAQGHRLSRESWTVKYSDSEDVLRGNNTADKTFDLQESTYWRTVRKAKLPHMMVIDLGSEQTVAAFEYLPRAEQGAPGSIKDYQIFVY
jgi:beta-galactosidase